MRRRELITPLIVLSWQFALSGLNANEAPSKPPLPTAVELKAAESRVLPELRADLASQGKAENAAVWFELAMRRRGDPIGQCVLLLRVRELAQAAGEVSLALEAIDALGERFQFHAMAAKAATVELLAKTVRAKPARLQLLEASARLAEEALAEEEFDLAERFAKAAAIAANFDHELRRRARVIELVLKRSRKQATARQQAVAAAQEQLKVNPDHRQSHAVLGLHQCFAERDWPGGLEHLKKAGETLLCDLAADEIEPPQDAGGRLALADGWWELALDPDRADQRARFVLRAAHWYRRALDELGGQAKARAQDRLSKAMMAIAAGRRFNPRRSKEAVEVQLPENVVLRLVQVPRGVVRNTAVEAFYLSETEITQEQWSTLMPDNPSSQRGDASLPVHDLTHDQANEFVQALNHSKLAEDFQFRLPTPAEWQHACLGSFARVKPQVQRDLVDQTTWREANSEGRLHVTGRLKPNSWGLFDMLGNCAEWTTDPNRAFGFSYEDRINVSKLFRQLPAVKVRAGYRAKTLGFRIAADRRFGP